MTALSRLLYPPFTFAVFVNNFSLGFILSMAKCFLLFSIFLCTADNHVCFLSIPIYLIFPLFSLLLVCSWVCMSIYHCWSSLSLSVCLLVSFSSTKWTVGGKSLLRDRRARVVAVCWLERSASIVEIDPLSPIGRKGRGTRRKRVLLYPSNHNCLHPSRQK